MALIFGSGSGPGSGVIGILPRKTTPYTGTSMAQVLGNTGTTYTSNVIPYSSKTYTSSPAAPYTGLTVNDLRNDINTLRAISSPTTTTTSSTGSTVSTGSINPIITGGESSGGGVSIAPYQPTYAPIPTPEFPNQLDADTIARLSEDAKNYAELAFAAGYQQLDQNLIDAARRATEEEAAIKPTYWQSMRDAIGMGATAAVRALQGANQLGRLRGGNPGELYSNAQMAGFNQASELESQLGERVSTIYRNKAEVEEDIGNLRASYKKEQGLTEAVQKATMMREELQRQIGVIQQKFENRLASSADARDWENVQLAYNQFKFNAEQAMWERSMTEKQLSAELQAQAASNQIALARLRSSSALSPMDEHTMAMDKAYLENTLRKTAAEIGAMGIKDPYFGMTEGQIAEDKANAYIQNQILKEAQRASSNVTSGSLGWAGQSGYYDKYGNWVQF